MEKLVTIHYKDAKLKDVLLGLESKFGIRFYYANNMIPVNERISVNRKNEPLSVVLEDIFKTTDITVVEVDSKIVLKKNPAKNRMKPVSKKKQALIPSSSKTPEDIIVASSGTELLIPAFTAFEVSSVPKVDENTFAMEELLPLEDTSKKSQQTYLEQKSRLQKKFMAKMDSLSKIGDIGAIEDLKVKFAVSMGKLKAKVKSSAKKIKDNSLPAFKKNDDSLETEVPMQLSFISPIGTNGANCGRITNKLSINALQGYSNGLRGAEFGGIMNVERTSVRGVQFAGISNVAGGELDGAQFAGITNINGKMVNGAQFAGIANINADSARAFQAAGILNVNDGSFFGAQLAGIANVNNGSAAGFQAAGITNVSEGQSRGMQIAGIANVTKDEHKGFQLAGIINRATRVRGSQMALINIADTVTGATVGLINIVKNGYNRLEIYGSESLYGNVGFRFGTHKFHSIIAIGFQPYADYKNFRTGFGAGFGSLVRLTNLSAVTFDLVANHIEEGNNENVRLLNLLSQFKISYSIKLANHLSLFAGPTFNVMTSKYRKTGASEYGSGLPDYSFYNETFTEQSTTPVNLKMWVGFNAGLRF